MIYFKRRQNKNWNRYVSILNLFFLSLICGCSLFAPVPSNTITEYQLNAVTCPQIKRSPQKVTLLVAFPTNVAANTSKEMAYSIKPYQIAYFSKNRWADTPSQMLEPLIVESLGKTHYFSSIGMPSSFGHYDYVLNTDIIQFNQVFFTHHSVFRFKLRAQITDVVTSRIVASHEFFAEVSAPSYSPYGGVIAANQASSSILTRLSNWVVEQHLQSHPRNTLTVKTKTTFDREVKP